MTCEQLKAHPVSPSSFQSLFTKDTNDSSSTESIGLQSEISTLHSYHTLNPLPILPTFQLMRLIRRTIYPLELRMGMMQRRIWLSWVIRMSFLSLRLFIFSPPHHSSSSRPFYMRRGIRLESRLDQVEIMSDADRQVPSLRNALKLAILYAPRSFTITHVSVFFLLIQTYSIHGMYVFFC